ncbi:MAG: C4-dicarboxylate ABC transporter permease [Spirochaetae bacterium HGW-Spirochaetae-9]|nr:MAG: C4-dicarboxylate ABC transporter permease [Spirochaetae bacterium HGW-Spirochaetae-9]
MFLAFILQVFSRFVLETTLFWTKDLIALCFVWTVLLGACYAMRSRRHVIFTLIYNKLKPRPAAWSRLAGNVIIAAAFLILIVPSLKYSFSLHRLKTAALGINYSYLFLPFVYLVLSVIGYTIVEIIEDCKVLRGNLADSDDHVHREYCK